MDEAQAGQERLVVLCQVERGAGAALTEAAPGWWRGQHQLLALEVPGPAEYLLRVVVLEVMSDRGGAGQSLTTQAAVQVSTGGDQTEAVENSRAMREVMLQL